MSVIRTAAVEMRRAFVLAFGIASTVGLQADERRPLEPVDLLNVELLILMRLESAAGAMADS